MRLIDRVKASGRRARITAAAGLLALGGVIAIAIAVAGQVSVPSPPPSASGTIAGPPVALTTPPPSSSAPRSTAPATTHSTSSAPVVFPARTRAPAPTGLTIPAISVHSTLVRLGKNLDGTLQVPRDIHVAGWYTGNPAPGEFGSSVIVGHVDSYRGAGVFFRLGDLRPGDEVDVARADGSTAVFVVQGVRQYPKNDFPTYLVYHDEDYPALRLITCGGRFDRSTGNYLSNIIAFARLSKVITRS